VIGIAPTRQMQLGLQDRFYWKCTPPAFGCVVPFCQFMVYINTLLNGYSVAGVKFVIVKLNGFKNQMLLMFKHKMET
jgi:hypothetical protein